MKNQYVADVNDFRKYGLIRGLAEGNDLRTAVCWMLTPDDGRADGRNTGYTRSERKHRHFDAQLFDDLAQILRDSERRHISLVEESRLLPRSRFYSPILADDAESKRDYFADFAQVTNDCDLIFFDPDNGLEVKSCRYGRKGSAKYLYWTEVEECFGRGHSILIYQHFPRVKREIFIGGMASKLQTHTGAEEIGAFRTPNVLFLLAPQEKHRTMLLGNGERVAARWDRQIRLVVHRA